jgi:NADPH2:quinone reductase
VLVTGGAGSVGHYAIQFARLLGAAQVIATVSGPEKAAHAMAAGADATINYRSEDLVARIAALTGGLGVERVVEVDVTSNGPLYAQIMSPFGLAALYGANGAGVEFSFGPAIVKGVGVRFFIVYELNAAQRAMAVGTLQGWLRAGLVKHAVAATMPLADCAAAHDAVEQGRHMGNLVLTC